MAVVWVTCAYGWVGVLVGSGIDVDAGHGSAAEEV